MLTTPELTEGTLLPFIQTDGNSPPSWREIHARRNNRLIGVVRFALVNIIDPDEYGATITMPGNWSDTQVGESYGAFIRVDVTNTNNVTWTVTVDDVVVLAVSLKVEQMLTLAAFEEIDAFVADYQDHHNANPAGYEQLVSSSSSDYFRTLRNNIEAGTGASMTPPHTATTPAATISVSDLLGALNDAYEDDPTLLVVTATAGRLALSVAGDDYDTYTAGPTFAHSTQGAATPAGPAPLFQPTDNLDVMFAPGNDFDWTAMTAALHTIIRNNANDPRLDATLQMSDATPPGVNHLTNLASAAAAITANGPSPFLYQRFADAAGGHRYRFFTHHGQGDDECGNLLAELAVLALPEVFAASGAIDHATY